MSRPKIVCVLNKSETYDWDYVEKLQRGIAKQLKEFEFVTLYGSRWPRWWAKMELFDPHLTGDILYFDLDTVIVGPIDDLLVPRLPVVLADFNLPRPNFMATGVMWLPEYMRIHVWRDWIANPALHMQKHASHGDGGFLSRYFKAGALRWQDLIPGQIVSHKLHCKDGVPQGARVVCFHGNPRPRSVNWEVGKTLCSSSASR